jgi:hypothetical protein
LVKNQQTGNSFQVPDLCHVAVEILSLTLGCIFNYVQAFLVLPPSDETSQILQRYNFRQALNLVYPGSRKISY